MITYYLFRIYRMLEEAEATGTKPPSAFKVFLFFFRAVISLTLPQQFSSAVRVSPGHVEAGRGLFHGQFEFALVPYPQQHRIFLYQLILVLQHVHAGGTCCTPWPAVLKIP